MNAPPDELVELIEIDCETKLRYRPQSGMITDGAVPLRRSEATS